MLKQLLLNNKLSKALTLSTVILLSLSYSFSYADTDGMDDAWETTYGLDPNDNADAALDLDGDGLSNLDEFLNDTFPNDKDSDNDGINDKTEVFYNYDPISAASVPLLEHTIRRNHSGPSSSGLGNRVFKAGDVNEDGTADYIISDPYEGNGIVRIYSGADDSVLNTIVGPGSAARFGASFSILNDLDGDNVNDYLIGASNTNNFTGAAFIISAKTGDVIKSFAGTSSAAQLQERFGFTVAAIGDLNNDNIDDIVIGIPFFNNGNAGQAYGGKIQFVSGAAPYDNLFDIQGDGANMNLGRALSVQGDVNGDGIDDVLSYSYNNSLQITSLVYFSGSDGSELFRYSGEYFTHVDDVNGDGIADIVVGNASTKAFSPTRNNVGRITVISGAFADATSNGTYFFAQPLWSFRGTIENAQLGKSVGSLGDISGDGIDDVFAYVPGADDLSPEFINVYSGIADAQSQAILVGTFSDEINTRNFGKDATSIGDVNQDGISDFIVSAPSKTTSPSNGLARVYISGLEAVDVTPDSFSFTALTNLAANTLTVSNVINITGIEVPVSISVSNGEMSINGGEYSAITTTVSANDTVQLRGTSSTASLTRTSAVLTVSGVSARFDMTTGDVVAPLISAPANITLTTPLATLVVNILSNGSATATDDVDANPVISHDQITDSVNFDAPGTYSIIWTATDSAGNSSNATQTLTINNRALQADLSVALNADVNTAVEGDNITYTITITNNGIDSASNVIANFDLPGNTSWVSNSAECSESAGTVTCSQGNLNNAEQANFYIVVLTTQSETLNATVDVTADEVDLNASNNTTNNALVVEAAVANLVTDLSRTGSTIIDVNETVTSTLRITNTGNAVAGNVSIDVRIQHYSNPDLQFTDIDLAQCSANGQEFLGSRIFNIYNCDLGDINPAQSVELIISATAPDEASEFIATMKISATSLSVMEENISINSAGTVEVDEGGGGSGSLNSLLLALLMLPLFIRRKV